MRVEKSNYYNLTEDVDDEYHIEIVDLEVPSEAEEDEVVMVKTSE